MENVYQTTNKQGSLVNIVDFLFANLLSQMDGGGGPCKIIWLVKVGDGELCIKG
jgi:hypothetical protein